LTSTRGAEPGVLPLQFLLHLAGGHWVACRGMQGSRDAGGVASGQCGAHGTPNAANLVPDLVAPAHGL
ncbi:MAG TPA: hypothetical protein VIO13_12795, partial [Candidatus Dormibacteraeota bacterium]